MKTGLLLDTAAFSRHDTGPGHPERPRRLELIERVFRERDLTGRCAALSTRAVTDDELLPVHTRRYIDLAVSEIKSGAPQLSTGDTNICPASLDAARLAAGGLLNAVDAVAGGKLTNAFCAVRPPGHHACADRGMGFCIFNNVAVAARYAQKKHQFQRIVIIDWDVHHGNGTQDIFYEDGSVFYFSTHQSPWYPGTGRADETGAGKGKGATLNCPLRAGSGMKEVRAAFDDQFLPAMTTFRPDLVLISAGFDSRIDDPLGAFRLTDDDFAVLTKILTSLAATHAQGRVVSVLEGGYNAHGLASAAAAHVEALMAASG